MGEITFIDMTTISLVPTLISLRDIFDTVKFLYENREKKKEIETQKKKKLDVTCIPLPVMEILTDAPMAISNILSIKIFNPKNYTARIVKVKLMEFKDGRKIDEMEDNLTKEVFVNSECHGEFNHNFPNGIFQQRGKSWCIRLIDAEDNWHDSKPFNFT